MSLDNEIVSFLKFIFFMPLNNEVRDSELPNIPFLIKD